MEESRQALFQRLFKSANKYMKQFASTPGSEGEPRKLRRSMALSKAKKQSREIRRAYQDLEINTATR